MNKRLSKNFLLELFTLMFSNRRVFDLCMTYLDYPDLPSEEYKIVWKSVKSTFEALGDQPTIGVITQQNIQEKKVVELLGQIKKQSPPPPDQIVHQFEIFIKSSKFLQGYGKLESLFNSGDKDATFHYLQDLGEQISNFSLKSSYYTKIIEGFSERNMNRERAAQKGKKKDEKISTGINAFDEITKGGIVKGDTACFLAQSGVGKSKFLKSIGLEAARRGFRILHIQAEGTEKETLELYDAGLAGQAVYFVENGLLEADILAKIQNACTQINFQGGEIIVKSYETFDSGTISDARELLIDLVKIYGEFDLVIFDYLELFDPGDGKNYSTSNDGERKRREAVANKMKNLAVEGNVAVWTATQASTVSPDLLNDPEFVQSRFHISEFKGVIKPFSYFITANQTSDEYEAKMMRLYFDKLRKQKSGQIVPIYQDYNHERFYDRQKTLAELYTPGQYTIDDD